MRRRNGRTVGTRRLVALFLILSLPSSSALLYNTETGETRMEAGDRDSEWQVTGSARLGKRVRRAILVKGEFTEFAGQQPRGSGLAHAGQAQHVCWE
jgi:hypothetical protein